MFHPSEVELSETTKTILADVERIKPARVVFDSLSELRLLAGNPLRYRRQILALKQFFAGRELHRAAAGRPDRHEPRPAGPEHRARRDAAGAAEPGVRRRAAAAARRQVPRRRASAAAITTTSSGAAGSRSSRGWSPASTATAVDMEKLASGIAELDTLLGGGIERGTSTLIVGAAGTGKSSLAAQFVAAGGRARPERRDVHLRREPQHAADPLRRPGDRPAEARRRGPRDDPAGRPGRAVAGRVRPRHPPRRRARARVRSSSSTA